MKQGLPSHKIGRKRAFLIKDLIRSGEWIKVNIPERPGNPQLMTAQQGKGSGSSEVVNHLLYSFPSLPTLPIQHSGSMTCPLAWPGGTAS